MTFGLRPFGRKRVIAGPTFTMRARSGDNLLLRRACDRATPGDIIVGDGGGDIAIALMGELMIGHARMRGVQGIVLDGAVREAEALAAMSIGVRACGATPSGPSTDGPGEIGYPVACGGRMVMPGDLVVADADGVVVVPRARAAEVIAAAAAQNAKNLTVQAAIDDGTYDRGWVLESLRAKGCAGA